MSIIIAFFISMLLVIITVLGDSLIKYASDLPAFSGWKLLVAGSVVYGLTGVGWFFVMRKIKLSTLGVWYAVGLVILLVLVSVFYFKEKITAFEVFGIALAIISLIILSRVA